MKKKTSNTERRTSNAERGVLMLRVAEELDSGYTKKTTYDLEDRLLEFAVSIVELVEALPNATAGNHLAGQLLRRGTSPYGHHGEVESAESQEDFVHKLKVCLKELRETRPCLRLFARLNKLRPDERPGACLTEADQLIRIFVASVRTTERRDMNAPLQFDVRRSMFDVRCFPCL